METTTVNAYCKRCRVPLGTEQVPTEIMDTLRKMGGFYRSRQLCPKCEKEIPLPPPVNNGT